MNRNKRTARKRSNLLRKGLAADPKSILGRWALRIWMRGRGWSPEKVEGEVARG